MNKKDLVFLGILDYTERSTDAPVPFDVLERQWLAGRYGTSEELAFLAFFWAANGHIVKRQGGYSRRLTQEEHEAYMANFHV